MSWRTSSTEVCSPLEAQPLGLVDTLGHWRGLSKYSLHQKNNWKTFFESKTFFSVPFLFMTDIPTTIIILKTCLCLTEYKLEVNQAVVFPWSLVQHTCMSLSLLNAGHQWPQGDLQVLAIVIFTPPQAHKGPYLSFKFCGQHKYRQPGGVCVISTDFCIWFNSWD